jgi:hypothetical protein
LARIESKAFRCCSSLESITILRHVQILCSSCFLTCESLSLILFETGSELTRIEALACWRTNLSLVLMLRNIWFIAGDAFPAFCTVRLAWSDCDAELRAWNRCR